VSGPPGKGDLVAKKTPSFLNVLTIGVIIGVVVIIVAVIAIHLQQRRTLVASLEGTLPKMEEKTGWQSLTVDKEGEYHYVVERRPDQSLDTVSAWNRLTYSDEGRKDYILRRQQRGLFVVGMDALTHRYILYDFKCAAEPKRYAIIKVFEVSGKDDKTLDYGKTGSQKDWEDVPDGTIIGDLAKVACRQNKK